MIEFRGEKKTVQEWADTVGISKQALYQRLGAGWSLERALTQKKLKSWKRKHQVRPGQRFGQMTVLREFSIKRNKQTVRMLELQCDCGNVCEYPLWFVVMGKRKSCGCLTRRFYFDEKTGEGAI